MYRLAVELGTLPSCGAKEFSSNWIQDDAECHFAFKGKGNGKAKLGQVMGIIRCAVKGIYDPLV